jgi:hypothetical protein
MDASSETDYNAVTAYLEANYGGSYEAYLLDYYNTKDGANYEDFSSLVLNSTVVEDLMATTAGTLRYKEDNKDMSVTLTLPENMLYDNFYQSLLSFVYGDERIKNVAGQIQYVTREPTNQTVTEEFLRSVLPDWYIDYLIEWEGCTLEDLLTVYCDPNDPDNEDAVDLALAFCNGYSKELGWYYYDEDGNKVSLVPALDYGDARMEADNDSWNYEGNELTVGDYMATMLTKSGAWADANNYFKELLAAGISSDEASWRAFNMALNLDGELTGNTYQLTHWSWYNSIVLYCADGDLTIHKEDEDGKALAGAGYELWEIKTTTNADGTTETVKEYFFGTAVSGKDADGNAITYYKGVFRTKSDETESCILYTDADGNIYIRFIDEEGGDDGQYYLQEVVAPDGYVLDDTVYDIVIKGGETTRITLVNQKEETDTPTTPDTPSTPTDTPTPHDTETNSLHLDEPLVPTTTLVEVDETGVPLTGTESPVPQTGDDTPQWAATALLALLGLLALAAANRERKPCKH